MLAKCRAKCWLSVGLLVGRSERWRGGLSAGPSVGLRDRKRIGPSGRLGAKVSFGLSVVQVLSLPFPVLHLFPRSSSVAVFAQV